MVKNSSYFAVYAICLAFIEDFFVILLNLLDILKMKIWLKLQKKSLEFFFK